MCARLCVQGPERLRRQQPRRPNELLTESPEHVVEILVNLAVYGLVNEALFFFGVGIIGNIHIDLIAHVVHLSSGLNPSFTPQYQCSQLRPTAAGIQFGDSSRTRAVSVGAHEGEWRASRTSPLTVRVMDR